MAVRIRLMRFGAKNNPTYRIVVSDSRSRRDGSFIEKVGEYYPTRLRKEEQVKINEDRIKYWLSKGATVTYTVYTLLKRFNIIVPKNQVKKK